MSSSSEGPKFRNMTVNECFQSRSTVLQGQPFGGIPTVLILNLILWLFVVVLYSFLRKAAWDYGRLALLIHNDSLTSLIYGEQSEKSSPSDISLEVERRDKGFCSWFFNSLTMKCSPSQVDNRGQPSQRPCTVPGGPATLLPSTKTAALHAAPRPPFLVEPF